MHHAVETLDVWKKTCQFMVRLHSALEGCREAWLREHLLRTTLAVAGNIAKGAERGSRHGFIRYLTLAATGVADVRAQLRIAEDIAAVDNRDAQNLIAMTTSISAMLQALTTALRTLNAETRTLTPTP
jgi:four helix bundle protein